MTNKELFLFFALLVVCVMIGNKVGILLVALLGFWSLPVSLVGGYYLWKNHHRINAWIQNKLTD